MRAEARKLGGVHEAVSKNRFEKYACAGAFCRRRPSSGLQIGREAGVDHRADFKGLLGAAEDHQPARRILDMYARFAELEEQRAQVFRRAPESSSSPPVMAQAQAIVPASMRSLMGAN